MRRVTLVPALFAAALAGLAGAAEPQAATQPPTSEARGERGYALALLKEHLAALASDDAEAREKAQDALIALGTSYRDEIKSSLASARNLEMRTRLKEILEAWARLDAYNTARANAQNSRTQESAAPPQTYAQRPGLQSEPQMEDQSRGGC